MCHLSLDEQPVEDITEGQRRLIASAEHQAKPRLLVRLALKLAALSRPAMHFNFHACLACASLPFSAVERKYQ